MNDELSASKLRHTVIAIGLGLLLALGNIALDQETASAQNAAVSWLAAYWNNTSLRGTPVLLREESDLNHNWGHASPDPRLHSDGFSARWTRTIDVAPGTYSFTARVDDGVRVWVDDDLLIDQWRDHWLTSYTAKRYLDAGSHQVKVEYYEKKETAAVRVSWVRVEDAVQHWRGEYFNNATLSGSPVLVRDDRVLNFYWGYGSPAPGLLGSDGFSVRWTRDLILPAGNRRFKITADDGVRLYVNGRLLVDAWKDQPRTSYYGDIYLPGGSATVKVEYYERSGMAEATLALDKPSPASWETYASRSFGVELKYPRHWQQVTGEKFSGLDGFFAIGAMDGDSLEHVARAEANHVLRPYGSSPSVEAASVQGQSARLILPSADQPAGMDAQSALIVRYPQPVPCGSQTCKYFVLYTDKGHIRLIGDTLRFSAIPTPEPDPEGTVIVDDSDDDFSRHGQSTYWHTEPEGYGGDLTWTRNNDIRRTGYNWARWHADLEAGHYEVFVYIPELHATTSKARYWVSHLGGYTLRVVDQSENGGRWVSLGGYMFRGTPDDHVSLSDVTYEPYVSRLVAFDAVKWVAK